MFKKCQFFSIFKSLFTFSAVCLQFFKKKPDSPQMHFGFTNIESEMHSFRVIAKTNFKFWFGSPWMKEDRKIKKIFSTFSVTKWSCYHVIFQWPTPRFKQFYSIQNGIVCKKGPCLAYMTPRLPYRRVSSHKFQLAITWLTDNYKAGRTSCSNEMEQQL